MNYRANTLSFLGDPDLTTPAHDALMLWIGDHADEWVRSRHAGHSPLQYREWWQRVSDEATLAAIGRLDKELKNNWLQGKGRAPSETERAEMRQRILDLDDTVRDLRVPPVPEAEISTRMEVPVLRSTNTIAGFFDAAVTIRLPSLTVPQLEKRCRNNYGAREENWVLRGDDDTPAFSWKWTDHTYGIEAKPQIRSLGELLRQLQGYKHFEPDTSIVVASPDGRWMDTITKQGFIFWETPMSF